MVKIEIYSTNYCPYCQKAKMLLKSLNLEFNEINVSSPDAMEELVEKTGMQTVPQIFINDKLIGGCDELFALRDSGKLNDLIK